MRKDRVVVRVLDLQPDNSAARHLAKSVPRPDAVTRFQRQIERGARMCVVQGNELYQKYLSPHKGFRCAFRVAHGGESCSQIIKHRVFDGGVAGSFAFARFQFARCGEAAKLLHAHNSNADAIKNKPHRWKKPRRSRDDDAGERKPCDACDAAQCACQLPDIVSCCARAGRGASKGAGASDCSPCDGDVCGVDFCGWWT